MGYKADYENYGDEYDQYNFESTDNNMNFMSTRLNNYQPLRQAHRNHNIRIRGQRSNYPTH